MFAWLYKWQSLFVFKHSRVSLLAGPQPLQHVAYVLDCASIPLQEGKTKGVLYKRQVNIALTSLAMLRFSH